MAITINQCFTLRNNLSSDELKNIQGTKLNYAIKKNLDKLEVFLKPYFLLPPQEIIDFHTETDLIKSEYVDKIKEATEEQKITLESEFKTQFETLKTKYQSHIDTFNKLNEEKKQAYNQTSTFKIHKVDFSDLPNNLTSNQLNLLDLIITYPK